jgi:hypothetical protein
LYADYADRLVADEHRHAEERLYGATHWRSHCRFELGRFVHQQWLARLKHKRCDAFADPNRFGFLALAVLNEIVWRTQSTDTWVTFKVFGVMPLTFIFAALQYPLLMKYDAAPKEE